MPLVVLTGASGSGKTAIAKAVASLCDGPIAVEFFDSIGVPPVAEMVAAYGSPERWQYAKTVEWMARLAVTRRSGRDLLFEGQTRLAFLADAAKRAGDLVYVPILLDCDDATRMHRLTVDRGDPTLADINIMKWASFMRQEARNCGCQILDTGARSLNDCAAAVAACFK
jgi:hypothetical protein